jgi:hypothetical protein
MNSASKRSYRKNLITNGLLYLNGEEREVSINNISMTGLLVQLDGTSYADNSLNDSLVSTVIDFYLPQLRLAGTAEIVRIIIKDINISLALKFKDISYNISGFLYRRKVYRKNISVQGRIQLNNLYYNFYTINVSVDGLMVRMSETIAVEEGMTVWFELTDSNMLSLKGDVQVVWIDFDVDGKTLLGLKYTHVNPAEITGIPRFYIETS